jgi:hypothetical protein
MPGERVSMRKIREVLRLRFAQGLSQRAIGASLRLSTGAVNACLNRARRVGLDWPHRWKMPTSDTALPSGQHLP